MTCRRNGHRTITATVLALTLAGATARAQNRAYGEAQPPFPWMTDPGCAAEAMQAVRTKYPPAQQRTEYYPRQEYSACLRRKGANNLRHWATDPALIDKEIARPSRPTWATDDTCWPAVQDYWRAKVRTAWSQGQPLSWQDDQWDLLSSPGGGANRAYRTCLGGREDDKAWQAANPDQCHAPQSANACDGVAKYLRDYPAGQHVPAANETLATASPQLDELAWGAAAVEKCRQPTDAQACAGVTTYLQGHPTGQHAAEAKAALDATRERLRTITQIGALRTQLCEVESQLSQVKEAAAREKRIDDASGTENLSQKRQVAATLIYLSDRRQALVRELAKDGKAFKRDRDCRQ